MMFEYLLLICILLISTLLALFLHLRIKKYNWKRKHNHIKTIGFFHPYCNAGGGGERVLWIAIRALQIKYKHIHCVVYTGDVNATKEDILKKAQTQLDITIPGDLEFVFLKKRHWVEAERYPYFTLLFQSLGSLVLGLEALMKHVPDLYIDTMGYAFTFPLFRYLGLSKVAAYVHYPTISTDMIETVSNRYVAVNNRENISRSFIFSYFKLIYYKIFALVYGFFGRNADVIMVNSSWTKGHIVQLWKRPESTLLVYPPCNVEEFKYIPLKVDNLKDKSNILSIAQFRPEKNQKLQLLAFHKLLSRKPELKKALTLTLIGGCRDEQDYQRVSKLKDICTELKLDNVIFKVNLPFKEVIQEMKDASIALHTMWNEHFGIGIVDCMSAGLIVIAHNSGGPKMDIVTDFNSKKTGFLASDIESFADAMETVIRMDEEEINEIRINARKSVSRFSVCHFEESFLAAIASAF